MNKPLVQKKQRHRARRLAMQALYQWHYNQSLASDLIAMTLEGLGSTKVDRDYYQTLVTGILNNIDRIDHALQPSLDRDLSELNAVELAILRVAVYEILERIEIPYRVVINEAVELAKEFGSQDGYKYVNAVLDKLARHYRSA